MATCGSLQHIFDNLLPENPTLLESLSWNKIKPVKSIKEPSSCTEIFGELHFKESSPPSSISTEINHTKLNQNKDFESSDTSSQTPSSASFSSTLITTTHTNRHKTSDSFSWLNSESLHLCTEGLGFESSDDVEDSKSRMSEYWQTGQNKKDSVIKQHLSSRDHSYGECRRSRVINQYPPPISCIGRTGKPWVYFMSYRSDGRLVIKEIKIPTQEFLHAYREDGRLKLQFAHRDDEFPEEEEDDTGSIDGEGEDMRKEDNGCVTHHSNEEKEID